MMTDSLCQKLLVSPKPVAILIFLGVMMVALPAMGQQRGTIELDLIEIESEVPRRVAQFFVQRDRLHYQPVDNQPSFLPELLRSVKEDPF